MSNLELFAKNSFLFLYLDIKKMLINNDLIQKINLIERIARVKIKELKEREDKLIIILEQGELITIIKQKGKSIKLLENMLHKKIKIVEFNKDPLKFVKSYIYPIKALNIILNNNIIEISVEDRKSKGLLIGRESKNLLELNSLIKNYYSLNVKIM